MEVAYTLREAAAKPRLLPPATRHPARASFPPGSRLMGTVRTASEFGTKHVVYFYFFFFYYQKRISRLHTLNEGGMFSVGVTCLGDPGERS